MSNRKPTSEIVASEFIARTENVFTSSSLKVTLAFAFDKLRFSVAADNHNVLHKLTAALSHLSTQSSDQHFDLTIEVYTDASVLKKQDYFEWLSNTANKRLVRFQNQDYRFFYNPGVNNSWPSLQFLDLKNKRAIFWIQDHEQIPWYELAAPFRIIFCWFLLPKKYYLIHAACIGNSKGGLLIFGKGGKGKTSTALTSFLTPGLFYVSDDYTVIKIGSKIEALALYNTAKVTPETLERFSSFLTLPRALTAADQGKQTLFFYPEKKEKMRLKLSIKGFLVPEVNNQLTTTYTKLSASQALLALAPSTIFQMALQNAFITSFPVLSKLSKMRPSFIASVSSNPAELGKSLKNLITILAEK